MELPAARWGQAEVQAWLAASGLQRHAAAFADNEIDGATTRGRRCHSRLPSTASHAPPSIGQSGV
jgi:hypothetical protein